MLFAHRLYSHAFQSACLAFIVLAIGCQSGSQTPFANPFTSAQVPPPPTRPPAPGVAQPYYPGDPVPPMQGALPIATPPMATTPAPMPPTYAPAPTYGAAQPMTQPQIVPPLPTQPTQFGGVLPAQSVSLSTTNSTSSSFPVDPNRGVADTGFTNPASPAAATSQPPLGSAASTGNGLPSSGANVTSPWRSPGVQGTASGQGSLANSPNTAPVQPVYGAQPTFGIQQTGSSPRVRMPQSPQQPGIPPGYVPQAVQPANYVAVAPGAPQTVGVTALPPQQSATPAYYQQAPAVNSGWQVPPTR